MIYSIQTVEIFYGRRPRWKISSYALKVLRTLFKICIEWSPHCIFNSWHVRDNAVKSQISNDGRSLKTKKYERRGMFCVFNRHPVQPVYSSKRIQNSERSNCTTVLCVRACVQNIRIDFDRWNSSGSPFQKDGSAGCFRLPLLSFPRTHFLGKSTAQLHQRMKGPVNNIP